ncbi:MAG: TraB/GumN family protein [Caulobacteraceae bacterium]
MRSIWTRGFLGLLAALSLAGAAQARPPMWVVRDKNSEMLLFGSVHILPRTLDWAPPELLSALNAADDLWFELPIDAASEVDTAQLALKAGVLPTGQSLFKLLPAKDAEQMSRVAAAYEVSPALLDRLQPWLAEISLAGAAYRRADADAASGVEKTISAMAAPKARRHAFETPEEQITMLSAGTMDEQIASLRETMQEMEDKPDEFQVLVKAWVDGDIATLDREALDPVRKASAGLYRRLVSDRNARWARVLDARLKGHGRTVVVVGVGHLIGPDGVPAKLRALGYSVTGP